MTDFSIDEHNMNAKEVVPQGISFGQLQCEFCNEEPRFLFFSRLMDEEITKNVTIQSCQNHMGLVIKFIKTNIHCVYCGKNSHFV
jgi:hypothetical protein